MAVRTDTGAAYPEVGAVARTTGRRPSVHRITARRTRSSKIAAPDRLDRRDGVGKKGPRARRDAEAP
jgi:hypothetical protein